MLPHTDALFIGRSTDLATCRELLSADRCRLLTILGIGGIGKTHAFRAYTNSHKNVIWLRCEKYWTRKYMLQQILKGLGVTSHGMTIIEMMDEIVDRIRKRGGVVLFIFDQFNKLRDGVKEMMIPIYNELEGIVGFFISGTNHLKTSFRRGVRLNKDGYQEMYSRMGRKFLEIKKPSIRDVQAIGQANGLN
ncbi:MAG: ATP-binding protein, partial [Chloroflexota bacterium]